MRYRGAMFSFERDMAASGMGGKILENAHDRRVQALLSGEAIKKRIIGWKSIHSEVIEMFRQGNQLAEKFVKIPVHFDSIRSRCSKEPSAVSNIR